MTELRNTPVKNIMIPFSNYVAVTKNQSLFDVIHALEVNKKSAEGRAHRDAFVVDEDGKFIGTVTMTHIFKALEPKYKKVDADQIVQSSHGMVSKSYMAKIIKDLNLWSEPSKNICQRGETLKVSEVMYTPADADYIEETDSLERGLHQYIMGAQQPLIVKRGDEVVGALRFGDLFEEVRKHLLACQIENAS